MNVAMILVYSDPHVVPRRIRTRGTGWTLPLNRLQAYNKGIFLGLEKIYTLVFARPRLFLSLVVPPLKESSSFIEDTFQIVFDKNFEAILRACA